MRAVDTNVLVRLLARDDEREAAAADAFVEPGAWISHLVLAETIWVLDSVYALDAAALARAIELLLHHRNLSVQDPDVVGRALAHYRERPRLGFSDCLVLEIARKAGHVPLGTMDRDLAKVTGVHLLTSGRPKRRKEPRGGPR